jgi:hypothetical protein
MRRLFVFLAIVSLTQAAELRKFQKWSTLGFATGSGWGEKVLEVEEVPGGSLVRLVYFGLRDIACGGVTVMAWEKHVPRSPEALANPVQLCRLPQDLGRLVKRHHFATEGTESDGEALVIQCGARKAISGLPGAFEDLLDGTADLKYMDGVFRLAENVTKAAWGQNPPDINVIDEDAERLGASLMERARDRYEKDDPFREVDRVLAGYRGPLGKPIYEWRFETPPGVKILPHKEPRLFRSGFDVGMPLSPSGYLLTVDPRSGKVTKVTERPENANISWVMTRVVSFDMMNWMFAPETVPADGMIPIQVHFNAQCGPSR